MKLQYLKLKIHWWANYRLDDKKEKKKTAIKSMQTEVHKRTKVKEKKRKGKILHQSLRELWNNIQLTNIHVTGIPEGGWGRKIF